MLNYRAKKKPREAKGESLANTREKIIEAKIFILLQVFKGAFLVVLILVGLGCFLAFSGTEGSTEITIFGQTLRADNVVVVAIFLAVVTLVLLVRRVLKSVDNI